MISVKLDAERMEWRRGCSLEGAEAIRPFTGQFSRPFDGVRPKTGETHPAIVGRRELHYATSGSFRWMQVATPRPIHPIS